MAIVKPKLNILVTGVGGRSVGSGILHSLCRSKTASPFWNIIAADADPFSWGLYQVNDRVILPLAKHPDYINHILRAVENYKLEAIIPGTEVEAEVLTNAGDVLPVPVIANRKEIIPLMMDKAIMREKMKELGLYFIPDYPVADWKKAASEFGFPLIAKPTLNTGGSKGLAILLNEQEAEHYLLNSDASSKAIIQPYIGNSNEEFTVGILSDKKGKLVDSIVMKRKLLGLSLLASRKYNNTNIEISTGYSQGYFIKDSQIQEFCEDISIKIGSAGPLNIQLRREGNKLYVFEIHPRFSGTTSMRADVGFNEPDILLRNYLFDEDFERLDYKYNVAVIRAFEHVVVPSEMMVPTLEY